MFSFSKNNISELTWHDVLLKYDATDVKEVNAHVCAFEAVLEGNDVNKNIFPWGYLFGSITAYRVKWLGVLE